MSELANKKCVPCEGNIPPFNSDPTPFFQELNNLNKNLSLKELSMGMSSDYIKAVENNSTYLRIGSEIFGKRT